MMERDLMVRVIVLMKLMKKERIGEVIEELEGEWRW